MTDFKFKNLEQRIAEMKAIGFQYASFGDKQQAVHHIHVNIGNEIYTIVCEGNFVAFSDLCEVLDEINSNYQHKVVHNG